MKVLTAVLTAEWLKTKRTPIRWLILLTPVVFAAFIIWYFSYRPSTTNTQLLFEVFFAVWTTIVLPLGAGLISGFMIHQEELAGSFNGFLGSKLPRPSLYLGKLIMLVLLTAASTFLATSVLIVLGHLTNIPVPLPIFIMATIIAVISTIPLLAFHLWISFAWGMGTSIGIGGGGILIAALMATSVGNKIWQYVPWGWPVRLSELMGAYLLYLPGMKYPPQVIASGQIYNLFIKGMVPAAIFFIIMLAGGLLWFNRWEGRKVYE